MSKQHNLEGYVRRRRGADAPSFDFWPNGNPPGVANLPAAITINGVTVNPTLRYRASGGGHIADAGPAMSVGGGGTPPADKDAYAYGSGAGLTRYGGAGSQYHGTGDLVTGNLGTTDLYIELLIHYDLTATGGVFTKFRNDAGALSGWEVIAVSLGGGLIARIGDGVTGAGYLDMNALGFVDDNLYFVSIFINRSEPSANGGKIYRNGSAAIISKDFSALDGKDCSSAAEAEIGARLTGLSVFNGAVQYCAMYQHADWFQESAAGPAEWDAFHKARFSLLTGQRANRALGDAQPSTLAARSDERYLRKEDPTLGTLWVQAGANIPAIEHDENGELCYAPRPAMTVGPQRNGDLGHANWTKRGVVTVTVTDAPDGIQRSCRITGLGNSGINDIYQSIAAVASGQAFGIALRNYNAESGVLAIRSSAAPGTTGDWSVDLSLLGSAWEWLTSSHPAVTVNAPWAAGVPCHMYAVSGAPIDIDAVFPTLQASPLPATPVLTTNSQRATGAESPMHWDGVTLPNKGKLIADIVANAGLTNLARPFSLSVGVAEYVMSFYHAASGQLWVWADDLLNPPLNYPIPDVVNGRIALEINYQAGSIKGRVDHGGWSGTIIRSPPTLTRIALMKSAASGNIYNDRLYRLRVTKV